MEIADEYSNVELARANNLSTGPEEGAYNGAVIPKQPENKEFGIGSNLPFSTPYVGPNSDEGTIYEVVRPWGEEAGPTVAQLTAMRRCDGQARALYRLMTQPIRTALKTAKIINPDDDETENLKETKFIKDMLFLPPTNGGMVVPFKKVIAQMLTGVFDGFAPFELVYWTPERGPLAGKYTLKKAAYRPASTITFLVDERGGFEGLRQQIQIHGNVIDTKIDGENVIYYAANEEERERYGVSYFQTAFYSYDKKAKLYYLMHLAAQRAAVGTRVGRMPADAGTLDKNTFIRALSDLGVAQYIALPGPDWEVEVLKDGGTFDFEAYINHHNSQMSKSVLANFFDQSQGGSDGTSTTTIKYDGVGSSKTTMSDSFVDLLKTIMEDIADVINYRLIPRFIDWNFESGKYPQFVWGSFTDTQTAAIRSIFDRLSANPEAVTPEFMRELEKYMAKEMGLEIDYDAVEAREEEEKAALLAQQEAQMAAETAASVGAAPTPAAPVEPPVDSLQSLVDEAKKKMSTKAGFSDLSDTEVLMLALANVMWESGDEQ